MTNNTPVTEDIYTVSQIFNSTPQAVEEFLRYKLGISLRSEYELAEILDAMVFYLASAKYWLPESEELRLTDAENELRRRLTARTTGEQMVDELKRRGYCPDETGLLVLNHYRKDGNWGCIITVDVVEEGRVVVIGATYVAEGRDRAVTVSEVLHGPSMIEFLADLNQVEHLVR